MGIESTAHSFSIGLVTDKGKVLSNVIDMYKPPEGWGIEPMKASEHHNKVKEGVLKQALERAKIGMEDIDLIAFSQGPGLPPCLYQGLNFGKELSRRVGKPLVGVNHCIAHIEIGRLCTGVDDPVTVYVSGGNTQIISFVSQCYRIFGEVMDIGMGNALDKFGRALGLEFPMGPRIENLAKKGSYIELPYTVKGMDLSFSGIITGALRLYNRGSRKEDLCFSLQETLFAMLTEVTERVLAHTNKNEVLLTGGVAANKRLQEMLSIMCRERGAAFKVVPMEFAGDNGGMIAWAGLLIYKSQKSLADKNKIRILPRQRTDEVDVTWIQ